MVMTSDRQGPNSMNRLQACIHKLVNTSVFLNQL